MNTLTWEDSYAIALTLRDQHPDVNLNNLSLETIYEWTIKLPEFQDDPDIANDEILMAIIREWSEEEFT